MKRLILIPASITLLLAILLFGISCNVGGVNIKIQGVSLGMVSMDGKPIAGLPSEKINLLLEVSAREINIAYTSNGTVLTLSDTASVDITPNGVVLKGVKPEQVKVEWSTSQQ